MGEKEINAYLTHLAVKNNVAASTQNQALCAIIFMYREVLQKDIGEIQAEAEGQLSDLPGEGEPLPDATGQETVDPGLAAGYRIMAEAGVVPEEFKLKQAIAEERARYQTLTDPDEKKASMARLADLDMRYNIAVDARRKFHEQ